VTPVNGFGWEIVGSGDYNGDGRSDILWRNYYGGANVIWWSANSATQQAVTAVSARTRPYVADSGDYNGDGASDILWRRCFAGYNLIWWSANSTKQLALTTVSSAWYIASDTPPRTHCFGI
jgi:hypothetical protein